MTPEPFPRYTALGQGNPALRIPRPHPALGFGFFRAQKGDAAPPAGEGAARLRQALRALPPRA